MNKLLVIIVILLGAVNVGLFVLVGLPYLQSRATGTPSDWYAVSLANGQLYFGHLQEANDKTLVLTDAFMLEILTLQPESSAAGGFQVQESPRQVFNLKRRGDNGVTVTDNTLHINRDTVTFWEKLAPDAEIVKRLEKAQ